MDLRLTTPYGRLVGVLLATGICLPAVAQTAINWPVPRHATFQLDPAASQVEVLSLVTGNITARLKGAVRLFLGDPRVPVPLLNPQPGWVGLSVDGADFVAISDATDPAGRPPLHLIQDPTVFSTGLWNTLTYEIQFQLYLTTPSGPLPVPQPVYLSGFLATYTDATTTPLLTVAGTNGDIPDAQMKLTIRANELPQPPMDIWFSTGIGFTSGIPDSAGNVLTRVSDGDLLSRSGRIVRQNHDLVGKLGIMPPVPDLGLDAVMLGPGRVIWFSISATTPIWSETLGRWLKHGDLLSETGQIVRTNQQLLAGFLPAVTSSDTSWDAGLDAVAQAPAVAATVPSFLFSTKERFFSKRLNAWIGPGDLLSDRGHIFMRNRDLLRNFSPLDPTAGVVASDYGLDAVVLRSDGEIWFSTEVGFQDAKLGPISDGDLLSTAGYVVVRNLDLVSAFKPVEDVANFGLDAVLLVVPATAGSSDVPAYPVVGPSQETAVAPSASVPAAD